MTSVYYAIAAAFEALFIPLKGINMWGNYLFLAIGTILTIGWINYLLKKGHDEGWNINEHKGEAI